MCYNIDEETKRGIGKMMYLILAMICKTVGAPDWCFIVCYAIFSIQVISTTIELTDAIREYIADKKNSNEF